MEAQGLHFTCAHTTSEIAFSLYDVGPADQTNSGH